MRALVPIRIVSILAFSVMAGALGAQDIDTIKTWSVEEFAQKLTDQMAPRVPLTPEQIPQVHKVNLKFAEQSMPVVKGTDDQKRKLDAVRRFDRQRSQELELFLSPEQMRQVRQIQSENRKKMKQRHYERH